jgi:hypothetical protein
MNRELTDQLVRRFPMLYRGRTLPLTQNLMAFGFEYGDGWYRITETLSGKLETLIEQMSASGKAMEQLPLAVQAKEKFGCLHYYLSAGTDAMHQAVRAAEGASVKTCEICGKPARLRTERWWKTLCDQHCAESGRELERYGVFLAVPNDLTDPQDLDGLTQLNRDTTAVPEARRINGRVVLRDWMVPVWQLLGANQYAGDTVRFEDLPRDLATAFATWQTIAACPDNGFAYLHDFLDFLGRLGRGRTGDFSATVVPYLTAPEALHD